MKLYNPFMVSYETSAMMGPPSINKVSHDMAHTLTKGKNTNKASEENCMTQPVLRYSPALQGTSNGWPI